MMQGNNIEDNSEDIEIMDLDEVEQNSPEDIWEDDWTDNGTDEPEPMSPWKMTLIFAGLVVLAALIAAGLWIITHRDSGIKQDNAAADSPVTASNSPAASAGEQEGENAPEEQLPEADQTSVPTVSPVATIPAATEPESQPEDQEPQNGDNSMHFDSVQEQVTPKDIVNLRSVPSTADADTIVAQAGNGEVLSRIGINTNTGWSKIDYNGQTLYAVTQYLTTDLSYKTPVAPADPNRVSTISGRVIIFTDCDDRITPKEYVNLRTEPSTTEGDATVSCQVSNGETVHRTGISPDSGWSRVEYNDQVLYVVTSLMQSVQ